MKTTIEVNSKFARAGDSLVDPAGEIHMMITPPLDEDYFIARVVLHRDQAIVIFPKFGTIGCGFAQEKDWNTNLPIRLPSNKIYNHIKHNKKYREITKKQCLQAIDMLRDWAMENCSQLRKSA